MIDIITNNKQISSEKQRYQQIFYTGYRSFNDPTNGEHISTLGELTSYKVLIDIYDQMQSSPIGQQILKEKPRVRNQYINIEELSLLDHNTFGYQYAKFMKDNQLNMDDRAIVTYINDYDLAYVYQRYKEIHDFLHVIFQLGISEKDEIILKWLEMYQLGLPSCTMAALLGGFRLGPIEIVSMTSFDIPRIMEVAHSSTFIMSIYYEQHFSTDIHTLRNNIIHNRL